MSESRQQFRLALISIASCGAFAGTAQAGGFSVAEVSAEGLGRANAGEAGRRGVSALWWNPAAVAGSGPAATVNVTYRDVSSTMTDRGSTITRPIPPAGLTLPVGGQTRVSGVIPDVTLPTGAVAVPIHGGVTLGLAVTHPFQLKTKFPTDAFTRSDTLRSRIDVTAFQAGLAAPVTPWLDVGAAFEAQRMTAYLDSASPNLNPASPDALQRLKGKGWDNGWTVGAQAHSEVLSVGVSYRAAVKHKLHGTLALSGLTAPLDAANFSAPAQTRFTTPWMLIAGASFKATPALTLSGQIERAGWKKYDKIDVGFAGVTASIPQGFKNTTTVSVGADYAVAPSWTIRGGVQYDPTPSPDQLREPGVVDADRWVYAVGASHELGSRAKINAAVAYSDQKSAPINDFNVFYAGTPAQTTSTIAGRYSGHQVSFSLGLDIGF